MLQLRLWDRQTVKAAELEVVNHHRPVYYRIWIEASAGVVRVCKQSGVQGRKPNVRSWSFTDLPAAEKFFASRVRSKTSARRKSQRRYRLVAGSREA